MCGTDRRWICQDNAYAAKDVTPLLRTENPSLCSMAGTPCNVPRSHNECRRTTVARCNVDHNLVVRGSDVLLSAGSCVRCITRGITRYHFLRDRPGVEPGSWLRRPSSFVGIEPTTPAFLWEPTPRQLQLRSRRNSLRNARTDRLRPPDSLGASRFSSATIGNLQIVSPIGVVSAELRATYDRVASVLKRAGESL